MIAQRGDVIGHGQVAAREVLGTVETHGQDRLLARLAQRLAVVILVDDGLADHQHLEGLGRFDGPKDVLDAATVAEVAEKVGRLLVESGQVAVDERRGAEDDVLCENEVRPMARTASSSAEM